MAKKLKYRIKRPIPGASYEVGSVHEFTEGSVDWHLKGGYIEEVKDTKAVDPKAGTNG